MIEEKYYSDISKTYWDTEEEAIQSEVDWACYVFDNYKNDYIAKDFTMKNVDVIADGELSPELYYFVPLTEYTALAFTVLASYMGEVQYKTSEFTARTPLTWDNTKNGWCVLPDLVKYAHYVYTTLSDSMANIEDAINEKTGEE